MKVQYVADDGTIFGSEVECMNYEAYSAFGSDTRFVDVVESMLSPLVAREDRGYKCIYFEAEDEKSAVARAIARNFYALSQVFEEVKNEINQKPLKADKKASK
jgi:hypothetical protein